MRTPPPELTENELGRRGVRSRVAYQPGTLQVPGQVEFIETVAEAGETRMASGLPIRLIIVDGRADLTPLQVDGWRRVAVRALARGAAEYDVAVGWKSRRGPSTGA